MRSNFYRFRQQSAEKILLKKEKKKRNAYAIKFPYPEKTYYKIFKAKYTNKLTRKIKILLLSFRNKYAYYVIDDILSTLLNSLVEKQQLLDLVYSSMLFLHNNLYINMFDIWVSGIYINENFTNQQLPSFMNKNKSSCTEVTLILFYQTRLPYKKRESLW